MTTRPQSPAPAAGDDGPADFRPTTTQEPETMNAKKLSAIAANVATKAAARRLQVLGWAADYIAADAGTIADAVQKALTDAWPAAMADAQAALDARMIDAATRTLEASFALAGIAAADAHHAATRGELATA